MSIFSKVTGIGINPFGKDKIKINPGRAIGTIATLGSLGALGPVAGVLGAIPGVSKVGSVLGSIPGVSKLGGAVSKIGGFLGEHGDQLLGAGSLYEGYKANQKSNDLMNEALHYAKDSYDTRAPLRTAGVSGMLNQQRPDLSSVYANPSNPYSRVR